MITRRSFLQEIAAALSVPWLRDRKDVMQLLESSKTDTDESRDDVTALVRIAIGTGGHGHTYPGATVPFGAVQLSPDTFNHGWDRCAGYHYSDNSIMGFSHTHLSGTGAADLLDFLVMPGTGPVKIYPGTRQNPFEGYRSRFSHDDEILEPGYYSVLLKDCHVRAELTATERAGMHRYTFQGSDSRHLILDLMHSAEQTSRSVSWATLNVVNDHTILGGRKTAGWANGREMYFAMKFSKPFRHVEIYSSNTRLDSGVRSATGKSLKIVVHYGIDENTAVNVKTGISGVSAEGALKNLEGEIPGWDFLAVRNAALFKWQAQLSKIRIETPNQKQKQIFYTSLYHMMLAPTLFDDVDGRYRGMDGQIHQLPAGQHNYTTFSLWDTYRAVHPMFTLLQRERVPDMVNSLIRMASESPEGMPVWPLQGKETGSMTGYHSAAVIAEACVKGFQGIDFRAIYPLMRKRAMADSYRGLSQYRKYGYIPCDKEEESASKTFEYAYDDWAVAHVARALGEIDDYNFLVARSKNYRNLFDEESQFVRPRLAMGHWAKNFDPKAMGYSKRWPDFTESNSWQTTFGVQHDVRGYIDLFGGKAAFVRKLDELFQQSSDLPANAPRDIAGLVGQYAHGNEPSHHIAYLYAYAGAPQKTQERVRSLLETMYSNEPDGLQGNEDCGQMSAWYVISALGFYAVDPVSGNYVFGTPLFDRATVELGDSKRLIIEAQRDSPEDKYIRSIHFNDTPYGEFLFRHADIQNGGTFTFSMASAPAEARI